MPDSGMCHILATFIEHILCTWTCTFNLTITYGISIIFKLFLNEEIEAEIKQLAQNYLAGEEAKIPN